jgi:hypothetical protein
LPHLKKASLVNFTKNLQPKISQKIGSMGAELFHVGTEMDRQTQHSKKLLLGIVLQGNLTTWVK